MIATERRSLLRPVTDGSGDAHLPIGAQVTAAGVFYRVWAPDQDRVEVAVGADHAPPRRLPLAQEGNGYFSGLDAQGHTDDRYRFQIGRELLPDPASRFQPEGVEGPSQVVDPRQYGWITPAWRSPPWRGRVIYELHIGTFTDAGTFLAAIDRLDALVDLGVNAIELMPLADFAGRRNWGYDGVMLFAPARGYGTPDQLRAFIDAAHGRGLAVILDVVYNHLGPVGNVLPRYSPDYLHRSRANSWGRAINFDGPNCAAVRDFFLQNACMWFDEYRVDGLRLDALHAIHDASPTHIVTAIAAAAHRRGGFVIGEDERNEAHAITPRAEGGWGLDAVWADDFHHTVRVALAGDRHAHFQCYAGTPAECLTTLRDGWLFSGQQFRVWQRPRGAPAAHLPPERFVFCISNHDQVGNRPLGDRLHDVTRSEAYRAASMLLCLAPYTPLLFMGQEWAASSPFPYFTDHPGEIGERIRAGRLREFGEHQAYFPADTIERMPDPQAEKTFLSAKLKWAERQADHHRPVLALYRECLRVRATEPVFQSAPRDRWRITLLPSDVLAMRWAAPERDWLLLVSLAAPGERTVAAEAVRPRRGSHWQLVLASNERRFGGAGVRAATGGEEGAPVLVSPGAMLLRET